MCLQTVWNSVCQDITYQGELLSGSEVCVGLAPHHLMFEITAQATQKAVSKRNFLINLFSITQKKLFFPRLFCVCLIDIEAKSYIIRGESVPTLKYSFMY